MIGVAIYIAIAVCVVVLGYFAGRERHQREDGVDIFRYPRVFPRAILTFAIAFPVGGATVVYGTFQSKPHGGMLVFYFGTWGLFAVPFLLAYLYTQRFEIRVYGDHVSVRWIRTKTFCAHEIRRLVLVEGRSGAVMMSLYDQSNAKLLAVDSGIQDFKSLLESLRGLIGRYGVACERRDKWGKWTRE